jgi:Putative DNA-binding domain
MRLAELQRGLQSHIVNGDPSISAWINESEKVPTATRLKIYSDAYRLRLIEALRDNFPTLHAALGDDDFATVCNGYIDDHPSRRKSIRWIGDQLSLWLTTRYAEHRWLSELARWEWAIGLAFDAADAQALTLADLAIIPPDTFSSLTFALHPAVQRVELNSNVVGLYKAHVDDTDMPRPVIDNHSIPWLIWRQDLATRYRSLADSEAAALSVLVSGGTFEQMCERLCEWHAAEAVPLHAATFLKTWVNDGVLLLLSRE